MTSAAEKRAAALRARMAEDARARETPAPADDRAARAHFVGATVLEDLTRGREVRAIPVGEIAPEVRPDLRQPRRLPLPDELRVGDAWVEDERALIEELLALGRSLQERQIQPILVYAGTSEVAPNARYLIAVGHRRWTAATLIGMPAIDAIVIDVPSPVELLDLQYTENEDRVEFSDMERAWALARMKQALGDAPWDAVERRFRISEGRRKQLMRLLAFPPPQQELLARLRAPETQLRPLHAALRDGALTAEQAERVLTKAVARPATSSADEAAAASPPALDGRLVARLVSQAQRTASAAPAPSPRPRWLDPLQETLGRARQGLLRASGRVGELDVAMAEELAEELVRLAAAAAEVTAALRIASTSASNQAATPHEDSKE